MRTADFDLTIDPLDTAGAVPQWCSLDADTDPRRAEAVAQRAWQSAAEDFATVTSIADLLALFERRSSMTFRRFSLQNYVQTDLAWGLLRIAHGDLSEGGAQLARFCAHFDIDLGDPVLTKAKAEARTLADLSRGASGTVTS